MKTNYEEEDGLGDNGFDCSCSQSRGDPISPSNRQSASQTLESLRNTSLTIFTLSTLCDLPPRINALCADADERDDLERRYDLALAILKHATNVRGDFESKRHFYILALLEYYKLLRINFEYVGVIESVVLLLVILNYDEQCLGLIDFCTKRLQDGNNKKLIELEDGESMEWVFGTMPRDQAYLLEEQFESFAGQQQWCVNAFRVSLFLIALRNSDSSQSARIGRRIENDTNVPFLRGLLIDSHKEWTLEDTNTLFSGNYISHLREIHFWTILKECVEDTLHGSLKDTITHMEKVLRQPPIQEQQYITITSLMDNFSLINHQAGKLHCLMCRQRLLSPTDPASDHPRAMRCSRCCVVHYCSRKCQKANFSIHKVRCKNIANLRSKKSEDAGNAVDSKIQQYDLAYSIVDMAYVSTDTIDRGRRIYHHALMEYYQLLELDFHSVGALESTLTLLVILGYDDHMLGLIDFVLYRLENYPEEKIFIRNNSDERLLEWTQGIRSFQRKQLNRNIKRIYLLHDTQWGANSFLLPLLISSTKKQTRQRKEDQYSICLQESAMIARKIEEFTTLPVLRGLLPDSAQRWTENEASELLCQDTTSPKHWSESCLVFWEILKDTIALTPKLADALEDTMEAMEEYLHCSAHPEAPKDLSGYAEWSQGFGNHY